MSIKIVLLNKYPVTVLKLSSNSD